MKASEVYKILKLKGMNLKARMLATFIPVVIMTLLVTGYFTYQISTGFLRITLENEGRIHVASLVHEIEQFLEKCRRDLLTIAQEEPSPADLSRHLASMRRIGGIDYRMLAFISQAGEDHAVFIAKGDAIERIPSAKIGDIRPNLFALYENLRKLEQGETWVSGVKRMEYPFPIPENPNLRAVSSGIYFGTTYFSTQGSPLGYLILAVETQSLKEISSLYHQRDSRIPPFPPEGVDTRYSYFFDADGWILFDSGNPKEPKSGFSTELARYGYDGILGNPENGAAFKPDKSIDSFWGMIEGVKQGKYGVTKTANLEIQSPTFKEHFCAFGPVMFMTANNKPPLVYGGVAFVDRSRMTEAIVYKQVGVISLVTLAAILVLAVVIVSLAHYITRPLSDLTRAVDSMQQSGRMEYLQVPGAGYETDLLKDSINALIARIKQQLEQIRISERLREEAVLRISADIEKENQIPRQLSGLEVAGIIGNGARVESLRAEILKAAGFDADVLIVGETGTGKQLAAEAIHRYGRRAEKPLVCINCGELDENLLLDSLFGHVPGAFTEAKKDRKGAFLEADEGILFLDEIQTASPSVQQALLRALSQRMFRPLGSDREFGVDVRVIAATNADLKALVAQGRFRHDLYFRLKVITIQTPSLREIREDIPLLVKHYFDQAKRLSHKEKLRMSKGALERMKNYQWPGNVRELMNCLTRAVIMAEGPVIQAEDILLDAGGETECEPHSETRATQVKDAEITDEVAKAGVPPMNERQRKAYPFIIEKGSISRVEYQWIIGSSVPSRTAIYDLQNLVKKGLLDKTGSGPSTRYVPAERYRTQTPSS
ncbi:MAG: Fis family transcriptional regulator [Deltaproteobacteria bacterium HGW-Deltaproteobacteria-15]|jgi:DNA-binding NtrC family response regulator|nr:MAG: Fis family transcriptional regulator [Deltaproteobacteria bacterium HGW-Deltaproteobacteria-15]